MSGGPRLGGGLDVAVEAVLTADADLAGAAGILGRASALVGRGLDLFLRSGGVGIDALMLDRPTAQVRRDGEYQAVHRPGLERHAVILPVRLARAQRCAAAAIIPAHPTDKLGEMHVGSHLKRKILASHLALCDKGPSK